MNAPTNLAARIAEIAENAKRKANRKSLPSAPLPKTVEQLPLWPEPVRAVPNGILRSALFGAVARGKRRYFDGEQIAALDGIEISFTGMGLDQNDLDVWEAVLHAVRLQELGNQCHVTSYSLLKLMGLTDTGLNRKTLFNRIVRLVSGTLTVSQGRYKYVGSLISEAAKDEESQNWVIELNPRLRTLFAPDQFTQIEWVVRHELGGKPLAQWLHGFYSSHAKPFPIKIETLHKLCGSEAKDMWKFTQTLRRSLDALVQAAATHGETIKYEIKGDLVCVEKQAKGTQRRHLAKKKPMQKPRS